MQKVTIARNQLSPLLDALIAQLEADGRSSQKAYFARVRGNLNGANDEWDLGASMVEISSGNAMGFELPPAADALMQRLLEKISQLGAEMDNHPGQQH
ncbi:MAG: hypothetical protein AAF529_11065 [Pseudomonadota bacterium]